MLSSPLVERCPGEPVPSLVSISQYVLHAEASASRNAPLEVTLPPAQWAFGIRFPLNEAALGSRPPEQPLIILLDVIVERGIVGIAGCTSDGSALTTPETFIGGSSLVSLTVARPHDTAMIVVRKASPEVETVPVIIRSIDAFEAERERLAPRGHDLGYDLFVILSAAKTGTQTIEATLASICPLVRIHRVHYASPLGTSGLRNLARAAAHMLGDEHEAVQTCLHQADAGDVARGEVENVRRLEGRVAFITAVREPIGRTIAELFQLLPTMLPPYPWLHEVGPEFAALLARGLLKTWTREQKGEIGQEPQELLWRRCLANTSYFDDELKAAFGIDFLSQPLDRSSGSVFLKHGADAGLALRTSDLDRSLPQALERLTGHRVTHPVEQNMATLKSYAGIYNEFLSNFRVPADLAEEMYRRHAYLQHFFHKGEILSLISHWTRDA